MAVIEACQSFAGKRTIWPCSDDSITCYAEVRPVRIVFKLCSIFIIVDPFSRPTNFQIHNRRLGGSCWRSNCKGCLSYSGVMRFAWPLGSAGGGVMPTSKNNRSRYRGYDPTDEASDTNGTLLRTQ